MLHFQSMRWILKKGGNPANYRLSLQLRILKGPVPFSWGKSIVISFHKSIWGEKTSGLLFPNFLFQAYSCSINSEILFWFVMNVYELHMSSHNWWNISKKVKYETNSFGDSKCIYFISKQIWTQYVHDVTMHRKCNVPQKHWLACVVVSWPMHDPNVNILILNSWFKKTNIM